MCMCVHVRVRACVRSRSCVHACVRACVHVCGHTYVSGVRALAGRSMGENAHTSVYGTVQYILYTETMETRTQVHL